MTHAPPSEEMKRRSVLQAAVGSVAGLGTLTMSSNTASATTATDGSMEDRIGHPLPETSVEMGEAKDEGAYVRVSVDDANGWRFVNAYALNDSVWSDGGPGQTSIDVRDGSGEAYLSTRADGEPARVPYGAIFALEAFHSGASGVYYSLVRVLPNRVWTFDASGVSDEFCWWEIAGECARRDALPPRLELPNGEVVTRG